MALFFLGDAKFSGIRAGISRQVPLERFGAGRVRTWFSEYLKTPQPGFDPLKLKVTDMNGDEILNYDGFIGTGMSIQLWDGGVLIDSVTVVISGDIDGNGFIDTTDLSRLTSFIRESLVLEGAFYLAADVDGNGFIDTTDLSWLTSHIRESRDLFLGMRITQEDEEA